jgi:hypothetical protein
MKEVEARRKHEIRESGVVRGSLMTVGKKSPSPVKEAGLNL